MKARHGPVSNGHGKSYLKTPSIDGDDNGSSQRAARIGTS